MEGEKLYQNLRTYLNHLDSVSESLPMILLLLGPHNERMSTKFNDFVKLKVKEVDEKEGIVSHLVKQEDIKVYEALSSNLTKTALATKLIPESLFVTLVSHFDAFMNRLLRALYELRPEFINDSERQLTFSRLSEFSSIKKAREYVVEQEIDSVLRKSHTYHFDYLEKRINMQLRTNLPIWKKFVELTERRNLLVHCDGVVSNQYVKVCREAEVDIGSIKVGDVLNVSPTYFGESYRCLYEIAVKLTHTLWRKLLPDDLKSADQSLNDICYELVSSSSLDLADIMLEFACNQKKHYSEMIKNINIVNRSLSKYLRGEKEAAKEIIESKDWSASSDDFKLARHVLNEDFTACYDTMLRIGNSGAVDKHNYRTWPLFTALRTKAEFKKTYKSIFNEDFTVIETPDKPVLDFVKEHLKKNGKSQAKKSRKKTKPSSKRSAKRSPAKNPVKKKMEGNRKKSA